MSHHAIAERRENKSKLNRNVDNDMTITGITLRTR